MDNEALFWDIAEELMCPGVEEGTMMGHRCLRSEGNFAAMLDRSSGGLIVKLSKDRVSGLIEDGVGQPFAPAGKVFSEWVLIPEADETRWSNLMAEATGQA